MKQLLLVSDDQQCEALRQALNRVKEDPFGIVYEQKLSRSIERLRLGDIDAIVADLMLPDSSGIETLDRLFAAWPHTPIMILSAAADEEIAIEAVRRGAQGYLLKGNLDSNLVPLALRAVVRGKTAEQAYYNEKARAEIALNSIGDAVICTDIAGNVDYLNTAAEKMTGWSRDEARGRPIVDVFKLINGITRKPERNPVELVLENNEPMGLLAATILVRRDGTEVPIEDSCSPIRDWNGKLTGVVIVFHDVTAAQAMVIKMAYLAQHDFLTNLPNRVLLNDRMSQAITLARRHDMHLAVLFLDIDNFKNINDSLGHATGDKLLQSVAHRLKGCVRGSDTVSRQGGDEFVILLAESRGNEDVASTADKIVAALNAPHMIGGRELHVTTSIDISVYPADGKDAETLIKGADTAMYHAKENGRNNRQFFRHDMNVRAVERQFIEASSLSYLSQFPIDVLKIDQSFVNGIATTPRDGVIAGAVIDMGNSLNLRVIAEGVETAWQLEFLKARHCEEGQGYLFSRPLVARDYALILSDAAIKAAS